MQVYAYQICMYKCIYISTASEAHFFNNKFNLVPTSYLYQKPLCHHFVTKIL